MATKNTIQSGVAGETIPELFINRLRSSSDRVAVVFFCSQRHQWLERSWIEFGADVLAYSEQLQQYVAIGDKVILLSENRYEWMVADLALQFLGGISVPLNPYLTSAQAAQLIQHSGARTAIASTDSLLSKTTPTAGSPDPLEYRLVFSGAQGGDGHNSPDALVRLPVQSPVEPYAVLQGLGEWRQGLGAALHPDSLMTILYTSGTTGEPKGVMLSQRNVISNVRSKIATLPLSEQDVRIVWLPMTHIFARVCDLYTGYAAGCKSIISLGRDNLWDEMLQFHPTYINGVPYFFEKCYRLLEQSQSLNDPHALHQMLGGNMQLCNCGGAPLADHVFDYFRNQGIELVTGYGLTETSPVLTSNRPQIVKRGSVGQAVPGVSVRVAADGEVWATGTNVMVGYYRDPEATEAVMNDGWFATGDLGYLDHDGFLYLIGRKKELIITTGGKNIPPTLIENLTLADPWISQFMVIGDRRDYLIALAGLSWDEVSQTLPDPTADPERLRKLVLNRVKQRLHGLSKYEQVQDVLILAEPFSIENGLLTPKGSLRRHAIECRYAADIDQIYRGQKLNRQ